MTTISFIGDSKPCGLCRNYSEHPKITSTNSFGSPDLDTRPPEMLRSTIYAWIQRCPHCGYCSSNIAKISNKKKTMGIVKSDKYQSQLKDNTFPDLASSFICQSILEEQSGKFASATWALIHAAWACDDVESASQAMICRKWAAIMLQKAEKNDQMIAEEPGASALIHVDLLRRTDAFDEAAKVAERAGKSFSKNILSLLQYQKELIVTCDHECHTMDEAFEIDSPSRPEVPDDEMPKPALSSERRKREDASIIAARAFHEGDYERAISLLFPYRNDKELSAASKKILELAHKKQKTPVKPSFFQLLKSLFPFC